MPAPRWKLDKPPPVEHRLLGLDRRLIAPTLGVLAIVVLWSLVMPAIDGSIGAREVTPGSLFDMGAATITPAPGWVLAEAPSPVGTSKNATLVKGSLQLRIESGQWKTTAEQLLARSAELQQGFMVEGRTHAVQNAQGIQGVARRIHGPDDIGLLVAFVRNGEGMTVTVRGPMETTEHLGPQIGAMIHSIRFNLERAP